MDQPFPNIHFSTSEFEQAGLLCGPELASSELQARLADLPASDYYSFDERAFASLHRTILPASSACPAPSLSLQSSCSAYPPVPAGPPAVDLLLEQILLPPSYLHTVDDHPQQSQPAPAPMVDTKRKKQLNCKHQKMFRERQKVLHFPTCKERLCC